jgi:preflagellin peptidase FlaK
MVFLIIASGQDIKRRRVSDNVWLLTGGIGIAIIVAQLLLDGVRWEYYLLLVPIAILFFDVFWDRDAIYQDGRFSFVPLPISLFVVAFVLMIWLFSSFRADNYFLSLFTVPVMILISYGLYYSGLIRGGADAKAIMSISVLVPYYPVLYGLPLISFDPQIMTATSILFPFALLVLMNASILFIFSPPIFLVHNMRKGEAKFPQCLFGYRVNIDEVPRFSWLMESVEDDKLDLSVFPKRRENKREAIRKLRAFGLKKVWVTPQIPFIVPISIGFLISFLVGNVFLGFVLFVT